ncbi:hypothetical protein PG623_09875 [Riemerella anatipestifer]|nr:hypothetical protein [Riemerella anatipestifer]
MLKAPLFCLKTWSFLLGAFSIQKGSFYFLSALAFPLVLCVFREGRHFLRLEVRYERLELSIVSSALKTNLQPLIATNHLTTNI